MFAALTYGWAHAARCRITLEAKVVRRAGPLGWEVPVGDIASHQFVQSRNRTYLVVVPHERWARAHSRALLTKVTPRGSVAGPLQEDRTEQFRSALPENREVP